MSFHPLSGKVLRTENVPDEFLYPEKSVQIQIRPELKERKLDDINAIMQEDISGIRIIKACVREIYEKARFGKANDELIKTQLQTLVIFAFMNPIVNAIMYILRYHTQ